MRRFVVLSVLGMSLLAGCASDRETCERTEEPFGPPPPPWRDPNSPSMLFDRQPGPYLASDFAFRSDWPSTTGFYAPSEVIYYREHFIDYEGRNPIGSNYAYRRFHSYRYGVGY